MSRAAFCQGLVFVVVVVSFDNHGPPIVMLYHHRVVTVTVPFVDLAVWECRYSRLRALLQDTRHMPLKTAPRRSRRPNQLL